MMESFEIFVSNRTVVTSSNLRVSLPTNKVVSTLSYEGKSKVKGNKA